MSMEQDRRQFVITGALGRGGLKRPLAVAIAGSIGLCLVLSAEHWAGPFRPRSLPAIETVVVDQGDVTLVVTENGSIESSVDDVIRCGVESFSRLPVGAPPTRGEPRPTQARIVRTGGSATLSASGPNDQTIVAAMRAKAAARLRGALDQGTLKSGATGPVRLKAGGDNRGQRIAGRLVILDCGGGPQFVDCFQATGYSQL